MVNKRTLHFVPFRFILDIDLTKQTWYGSSLPLVGVVVLLTITQGAATTVVKVSRLGKNPPNAIVDIVIVVPVVVVVVSPVLSSFSVHSNMTALEPLCTFGVDSFIRSYPLASMSPSSDAEAITPTVHGDPPTVWVGIR